MTTAVLGTAIPAHARRTWVGHRSTAPADQTSQATRPALAQTLAVVVAKVAMVDIQRIIVGRGIAILGHAISRISWSC